MGPKIFTKFYFKDAKIFENKNACCHSALDFNGNYWKEFRLFFVLLFVFLWGKCLCLWCFLSCFLMWCCFMKEFMKSWPGNSLLNRKQIVQDMSVSVTSCTDWRLLENALLPCLVSIQSKVETIPADTGNLLGFWSGLRLSETETSDALCIKIECLSNLD